eukprot:gene32611-42231_t
MQRTSIGSDDLNENRRSISSVDNNNIGRSSVSSDTKGRVSISSNDSSNSRPSKNFGSDTKNEDNTNKNGKNRRNSIALSSVHSDKSSVDSDGGDEYGETTRLPEDAGFMEKLTAAIKKGSKTFVRAFVDYGPPYSDEPYNPVLGDTCAKPVANNFKIHNILNRRWNPNQPDPQDFFYYPIHWCARNLHLMATKMLFRAGAKVNVTTELGNTPLDLAVMIQHPKDKRKTQMKLVNFLLENGAEVNTRDKGGFSPIDHAAFNNDLEIIQLLLEYGADLVRENNILVAPRTDVLKYVHDPDCFRVLYERRNQEIREREERKLDVFETNADDIQQQQFSDLLAELKQRKEKRAQMRVRRQQEKAVKEITERRRQQLQKEKDARDLEKQAQRQAQGLWKRDANGCWQKVERTRANMEEQDIFAAGEAKIAQMRLRTDYSRFSDVWAKASGGGKLEMEWKRSDPFRSIQDSVDRAVADSSGRLPNSSQSSRPDRDMNDMQLEGEDLDEIMDELNF